MLKMSVSDRIAYGTGVFFIIFGILIGFSWPFIFNYVLKEKLALSPSSETYKLWVRTPIPMYLEVYLFNWTNSEEFLKDKRVKPQFEEIGPFVFKEVHQRVNITWNANNTVSYNQTRTWYFVPEESVDLSTPVWNLNVVATTITKMASGDNPLIKIVLDILTDVYKEKLVISRPASEWLFDGMNDKLLDLIRLYVNIPYKKFGWFYGRNLSAAYDGEFNINTGKENIFHLGEMQQWNYVTKTKFYEGECAVVNGGTGELFSPIKGMQDNLTIFVTDFCGPLKLKYSGEKVIEGINGFHYIGDNSVFDNGTTDPKSKCFCRGECIPSGVRNITSCRQAPLFISFPHFYLADSSYTDAVVGMKPNKSEHEFYISIDSVTGIPLEVRAQVQLNVLLQPLPGFPMFEKVPKIYIPMMWFRQRANITQELASRGKTLRTFSFLGLWLACSIGSLGLFIIIARVCYMRFCVCNKTFELLITSDNTEEEDYTDDRVEER